MQPLILTLALAMIGAPAAFAESHEAHVHTGNASAEIQSPGEAPSNGSEQNASCRAACREACEQDADAVQSDTGDRSGMAAVTRFVGTSDNQG